MNKKPFRITLKDKKLLKSSKVRKWLSEAEDIQIKEMESNGEAWWSCKDISGKDKQNEPR